MCIVLHTPCIQEYMPAEVFHTDLLRTTNVSLNITHSVRTKSRRDGLEKKKPCQAKINAYNLSS